MPWSTAYRMRIKNVEGANITVYIYDTTSLVGPPASYIDLTGSGDPLHLFTVNNAEDLFSPIRALQAEIRFLSTSTVNVSTFFTNDDNRYQVEIYSGSTPVFIGFLLLDDVDEDFLDPATNNEVTLTATDNIGKLKDSPLLDFSGNNPRGYYTLAQYVGMALNLTGLSLNINICHNVREENNPTQTMFNTCYLQSKTFERDINESVNAYQVLEMILKEDSFITQYAGEWWIMRLDEIQGVGVKSVFNPSGVYSSTSTVDLQTVIGPNETIFFSDKSTLIRPKQPIKNLRLVYNYNYPREIVDNIDFSRSETPFVTGAPYVDPDDGLTKVEKRYTLEDWTTKAGTENTPVSPTVTAYVRRIFVSDYEKERYAVLPATATLTPTHWLQSGRIPVGRKDKFNFNIDFSMGQNLTGGDATQVVQVILYGDDGSKWVFGNRPLLAEPYTWRPYVEPGVATAIYLRTIYNKDDTDEGLWQSISAEISPMPVAGELSIRFLGSTSQDITETRFDNLQMDYIPYINGSYAKYSGQYNNISQAIRNHVREEEVSISDAPRKLFKGALFRYNGTAYVLTDRFYDGLQFGSTVPGDAFLHPFGFNQAFAVWNKNNRSFSVFDFHAQGINSTTNIPSCLHRFSINEASPYTTNKKFALVHFDMDYMNCELKGVLCEVSDSTIANVYDDDYLFKYVSDR